MKTNLKQLLVMFTFSSLLASCASVEETKENDVVIKEESAAVEENKIAEAESNPQGVICRKRQVTGSRFSKKVCTTAEQRQAAKERSKAMLDKVQNSAVLTNMEGG